MNPLDPRQWSRKRYKPKMVRATVFLQQNLDKSWSAVACTIGKNDRQGKCSRRVFSKKRGNPGKKEAAKRAFTSLAKSL